jgi:hypothetical protein
VASEIVHHDDVAGGEIGNENLIYVGLKRLAIDWSIEHQRRNHAIEPQASHECCCFPMPMRNTRSQAHAFGSAAACPRHVGRTPRLVDEHEASRIEVELVIEPILAPLQDIWTALLAGVRSLFLNVIRRRSKNRQSVETATWTSRSASSARSSTNVISGLRATASRMKSA